MSCELCRPLALLSALFDLTGSRISTSAVIESAWAYETYNCMKKDLHLILQHEQTNMVNVFLPW